MRTEMVAVIVWQSQSITESLIHPPVRKHPIDNNASIQLGPKASIQSDALTLRAKRKRKMENEGTTSDVLS